MTDSLKAYRAKRDFNVTTEPAGGQTRASDRPIFVIQRHDASTLHYDFRLEVDGVLKSWAVPKGPPDELGERRLAVPTEDHPMGYANFEGRIPKGQYGAGKVEIWDSGTYRNLRETGDEPASMNEALDEGKVEIFLEGRRLHGPYALIRTAGGDEPRWLWLQMKSDEDNEKS
ncbi:DNA polymerase ligase N-terminal domain-containing protein [Promineifilum sp.]|uniref:DNA polymerase ligase N-terminal domain-containing protein n=1 Tax=Promineifilum sp. TaxID=2664178 RepID=UPI0035B39B6C